MSNEREQRRNALKQRRARLSEQQLKHLEDAIKKQPPLLVQTSETTHTTTQEPSQQQSAVLLSFAQERLWFLHQWESDLTAYHIPGLVRLQGNLDVPALQQSWQHILQRHETMRLRIETIEGQPKGYITEQLNLDIPLEDLTHLSSQEQKFEVRRQTEALLAQPFQLDRPPLYRIKLFRLSDQKHLFFLVLHHLIADAWSLRILGQEIAFCYHAFLSHKQPMLPKLLVQYSDFAQWQRENLTPERIHSLQKYWVQQLEKIPPLLQLSTDYPRGKSLSFKGDRVGFPIPYPLQEKLQTLCREHNVTPFMFMLSAWQLLMARYAHQETIVTGVPVAQRHQLAWSALVGLFLNSLPIRTCVQGSFLTVLYQVRDTVLHGIEHQELPFDKIVEALDTPRHSAANPIFQTMCAWQDQPLQDLQLPGLQVEHIEVYGQTAMLDLFLSMTEQKEQWQGFLEYNTSLWKRESIVRLSQHFLQLLQSIAQDPKQDVTTLSLLSQQERAQIIKGLNPTSQPQKQEPTHLWHLFATQVKQTPNAIAARCKDSSLTFQELDGLAQQVAQHLLQKSNIVEEIVGVCMERSLDMLVALMGILRAGKTYLPLDPKLPPTRLQWLIKDAQCDVVLTHQATGLLQPLCEHSLPLEDIRKAHKNHPHVPMPKLSGNQLAYLIYTSGSTGQPKGVMVEHSALCHLLESIADLVGWQNNDTLLAVTTLSFDISALELFLPLARGGCVSIASSEDAKDGTRLRHVLNTQPISWMQATPETWKLLIQAGWEGCPELTVLCGGEALTTELAHQLQPRCQCLWNVYGPTETTIWSTAYPVKSISPNIPIGQPIGHTVAYVLDENQQLVPVGVPGELYLGGPGLARGYWQQASLTDQVFVANSIHSKHSPLLYRTGDLVRYDSDGDLVFLNRIDQQLKLRGFRIEPGEIEHALRAHPDVMDAIVTVVEENNSPKQLCAYYVPQRAQTSEQETIPSARTDQTLVQNWHYVWDNIYQQIASPTQQYLGWTRRETGEPIPPEEMKEWIHTTVQRILELQPRRVLEIGVGQGLLLFPLAPHCEEYIGTDFSEQAILTLKNKLSQHTLSQVTLIQKEAIDLEDLSLHVQGGYDLVIINSVAQYFSSESYLKQVIQSASALVQSGGYIFLGDLRNLETLAIFHSDHLWRQSGTANTMKAWRHILEKRQQEEPELLIAPNWFANLTAQIPKITSASLLLRRGYFCNEMTQHRYDALLTIGRSDISDTTRDWLDWQSESWSTSQLCDTLAVEQPEQIALRNIPNARLSERVHRYNYLMSCDEKQTFTQANEEWQKGASGIAPMMVEPEDLWDMGKKLGYRVGVFPAQDSLERMDVVFKKKEEQELQQDIWIPWERCDSPSESSLPSLTNQPFDLSSRAFLDSSLRDSLAKILPHYMVPTLWVELEHLPLTPNGKLDRRALPNPTWNKRALSAKYVAPRNAVEQTIAEIWQQVLQVEKVGIHDNFFALGGASLLSIQIVNQAQQRGIALSPESMFTYPTIAQLVAQIPEEKVAREEPLQQQEELAFPSLLPSSQRQQHPVENPTLAVAIESLGVYLPNDRWSTEEVLLGCHPSVDFPLAQFTGIQTRPVVGPEEYSIDLAYQAATSCLQQSSCAPEDIDLVICANISRVDGPKHRFSFEPCTSARLTQMLGLEHAQYFDVNNACAGVFTAILMARAYLQTQRCRRVMIVSGEYLTHLTHTAQKEIQHATDPRMACLTLGDAGIAMLLSLSEKEGDGFQALDLYTLSNYARCCIAQPTAEEHGGAIMVTDSVRISAAGIPQASRHSIDMLYRQGWTPEQIQHLILHQSSRTTIQGSMREINKLLEREACTTNNTIDNLTERGNTATTSHFIALYDNIRSGHIQRGDKIVFSVTGSGLTIGTALYEMDDLPERINSWRPLPALQERATKETLPRTLAKKPLSQSPLSIKITGLGLALPEKPEKADTLGLSKTAVLACIQQAHCSLCDVDILIFVGVYRDDFICEPAIATLLAHALQLNENAAWNAPKRTLAFDISNGSPGFLNACEVASQLIQTKQYKRVLVVSSEIEPNACWDDIPARKIRPAATAVLLEAATAPQGFGRLYLSSAPQHLESLVTYTRQNSGRTYLQMDCEPDLEQVYLSLIPPVVDAYLAQEQLTLEDIDFVIPPQLSSSMWTQLCHKLDLPPDRCINICHPAGDWLTSTLPAGLHQAEKQGFAQAGQTALLITVGSGLQVGCILYRY